MSTSNGLISGYMYCWDSLLPVNEGVSHPWADPGFFQGVLGVITIFFNIYIYIYIYIYICDWILENQPNCHTRLIPFYWPN